MAVTREQILAAADEIAANGQAPTMATVRDRVGGSYSTIGPVLREWKARQASAATTLREPAPAAVTERLGELGAEIWAVAMDLASARLATEREGLERARVELEGERAEATELADRLNAEVDDLRASVIQYKAYQTQQQARVEELLRSVAQTEQRERVAETRAGEVGKRLGDTQLELQRARDELQQARDELAKVRDQLHQTRETTARLQAEAEIHQSQRKQSAAEAHRLAERLTKAQAEREGAHKVATEAREAAAHSAGELGAPRENLAQVLARLGQPDDTQRSRPGGRNKGE